MAIHIDAQTVRQVGSLAKLSLTEAQLPSVALDLQKVLDLVAVLDEVDVTDVTPLLHPHEQAMVPRADIVQPGLTPQQALANAPAEDDGCFLTPRVVG